MKKLLLLSAFALAGCVSNDADTATPAPTNLTGIYKAPITGGSITWEIFSDGTGIACEQRTSVNTPAKLRDMVINGHKAYDVFTFEIKNVTNSGFMADGITELTFTRLSKLPIACQH